ncbi:MAG: TIGR00268 family protein, partial [Thaumarchaeota archaeon]|nr:TIGR00268 family protein [Nitrososphaerota archaeon]
MTDLNKLLKWFDDKDKVLVSLSGGVDSALVAYAANKKLGKNAIAVTADYKTLSSEELDSAKLVASEIGITHH